MRYVIFNPSNGDILAHGETSSPSYPGEPGRSVLSVESLDLKTDTHYVDRHRQAVVPRKRMAAHKAGDKIVHLPPNASVVIEGQSYDCRDSEVTLEFDQPGPHTVEVVAPEFLKTSIVFP